MDFIPFKVAVARQFQEMSRGDLYRTTVDGDSLWTAYLESFPPGTNPIFRERTEHDCSCCRQFIRTVGNVVTVHDGALVSIWDVTIQESAYQIVVDVLSRLVKSHPIDNVFLYHERTVGIDRNYENFGGSVRTWEHFHVQIPLRNDRPVVCDKSLIGARLAEHRASHDVFLRSLEEIDLDTVKMVLELIDQNSLYRGEENRFVVDVFSRLKREWDSIEYDENDDDGGCHSLFIWSRLGSIPESVARIRNTAIGSLLVDLSGGVDLEAAVRSFEAKVAPTNYKRPTALVTKAMVDAARAKLIELGLTSAVSRRYATLDDVRVNNLIFVDRALTRAHVSDVFDDIQVKPRTTRDIDKVPIVSMEAFLIDIVPSAKSIDVMFDSRFVNNLVSLIAPEDPLSDNLFKWDNRFSWSYNGDVTDSIKEKVKQAGGNVTGDLCCRLAWFNHDDLDFHMREPGGYEIYYGNRDRTSPNGGRLDVDMNAGRGTTREPVENIFYFSRHSMKEGVYHLFVHQYQRRETTNVGFDSEIDFMGTTYNFSHATSVNNTVTVAKFTYLRRDGGVVLTESLPVTTRSRTVWGVGTNQFCKVRAVMLSPNYWGERAVGNKHYFFILDGCRNDGHARGFYNEFLREDLTPHRKVLEIVGSKAKTEQSDRQLSGLGFSSTQRNEVLVRVSGDSTRTLRITI